jgi:hypothetical protein
MDLIGKTLSELSPEELESIVIFLDIDDTLGNAIDILEINTDALHECIPRCKLLYVYDDGKDTYVFCYYIKHLEQCKRIEVTFRFRKTLLSVLQYFKEKNIYDVYLLSAASEEYIEGIHYILQVYYYFDIKGYKSVSNVQQRMILEKINGNYQSVLYMEKDMIKAMDELDISLNKIPILFDDKPYWAKNGLVVPIEATDSMDIFIDVPIQLYKEPLFIIYE